MQKEFELLAILYATKNCKKLSASQMDAIKNFAVFLDTRNPTPHEADSRIRGAVCPECGEELECTTSKCKYVGQIPPRS